MAHDVAAKLAEASSATIDFGRRLLFLQQHERGITAYVETPRTVVKYHARHLIGADGANSIIRKIPSLSPFDVLAATGHRWTLSPTCRGP